MKGFSFRIAGVVFAMAALLQLPASAADSWTQVVGNGIVPLSDGFGVGGAMNTNNTGVEALCAYNGFLYAAVGTTSNSLSIWRSSDLFNWTNVASFPPNVFTMYANTNGIFFAGGGDWVWKSTNGVNWSAFTSSGGFDRTNNVSGQISLQGNVLYLTTANINGSQVWKRPADGSANWTKLLDFGTGFGSADGPHTNIGQLYIYCPPSATNTVFLSMSGSSSVGYLYETVDGGATWYKNTAVGGGFGGTNIQYIASLIEFNGCLYAGTGNAAGGQIWRTPLTNAANWSSTNAWQQVASGGFGITGTEVHRFAVAYGQLWTFLFGHTYLKARVWRTGDGINWVQSNMDNFGTNEFIGNGALAPFTGKDGKNYMLCGSQWISPSNSAITAAQVWQLGPIVLNPSLQIKSTNAQLQLCWPAGALGFGLETCTNLVTPVWTAATNSSGWSNGQDMITFPVQPGSGFYRLHQH